MFNQSTIKLNQRGHSIMSTTNDEEVKWNKWGDGKTNPELKKYIELLIQYNNQRKEILEDTKKWLLTNGNQSR